MNASPVSRFSCLLLVALLAVRDAAAQPAADDERDEASLAAMRALAADTDVRVDEADETQSAELLDKPVFRYSDAVRGIRDATLWAWTVDGLPVAFQKVEDYHEPVTGAVVWTYCFTTASPQPVRVAWSAEREFASAAIADRFLPLVDGPAAAAASAQARQLRTLARRFSGTIYLDSEHRAHEELRLLTRPLLEYSRSERGVLAGAVFGLAFGTNPDMLLVLELRGDSPQEATWHFAAARMTTGGLSLRYGDREVWSDPYVEPQPTPFDTWTFFYVPRE